MLEGLTDSVDQFLRSTLGPPLKSLHQPLDQWLGSLSMTWALISALGLYCIAVIWVWTLPRTFVFRGAKSTRRVYDLRIWATLVVIPYVVVYLIFGR